MRKKTMNMYFSYLDVIIIYYNYLLYLYKYLNRIPYFNKYFLLQLYNVTYFYFFTIACVLYAPINNLVPDICRFIIIKTLIITLQESEMLTFSFEFN